MKQTVSKKAKALAMLALFFVTMLWGAGFVFTKYTLEAEMSPAAVLLGRFGIAAVLTGLVFFRQIRREYRKGQWKGGLIIGSILWVGFIIQTTALKYTTPANNAFLTGIYVVMVPFIWWAFTKKRPPAIIFIACLISFIGVAVLALDPSEGLRIAVGDTLTLVSALLFAGHIVATGHLAETTHPTVLVFMQFAVGAVLSLAMFLVVDRDFSVFLKKEALIGLGYLGLLSTELCYFLQVIAQRYISSAKAGIIMTTEALFGTLFSVMAGYDVLTPRMVVGGLIMFTSIAIPELWAARRGAKQRPPAAVAAAEAQVAVGKAEESPLEEQPDADEGPHRQ